MSWFSAACAYVDGPHAKQPLVFGLVAVAVVLLALDARGRMRGGR